MAILVLQSEQQDGLYKLNGRYVQHDLKWERAQSWLSVVAAHKYKCQKQSPDSLTTVSTEILP